MGKRGGLCWDLNLAWLVRKEGGNFGLKEKGVARKDFG